MFEGRIKDKSCEDPRESSVLHRMRWTDLVARLAATRDLRDELGTVDAGFNAFGEVRRESHEEGKSAVNHDILSDGKAVGLGLGNAANDAVQGDRERE